MWIFSCLSLCTHYTFTESLSWARHWIGPWEYNARYLWTLRKNLPVKMGSLGLNGPKFKLQPSCHLLIGASHETSTPGGTTNWFLTCCTILPSQSYCLPWPLSWPLAGRSPFSSHATIQPRDCDLPLPNRTAQFGNLIYIFTDLSEPHNLEASFAKKWTKMKTVMRSFSIKSSLCFVSTEHNSGHYLNQCLPGCSSFYSNKCFYSLLQSKINFGGHIIFLLQWLL